MTAAQLSGSTYSYVLLLLAVSKTVVWYFCGALWFNSRDFFVLLVLLFANRR